MRYRIEYFFFALLIGFMRLVPEGLIHPFGKTFGRILRILGIRKKVVLRNLEIAFGDEKSPEERDQLCREIYDNLGSMFFEFLYLSWTSPEKLDRYLAFEGLDEMVDSLEEGKGAVVVTGHFGHWELQSAGMSTFGKPLFGYAGMQKNPYFDERINQMRRRFGMTPISKSKNAPREMLKVLKSNEILGIIGDLNVPHDTLFVDFFGKKAAIGQGVATFTVKRNAPLFFTYVVREEGIRHRAYMKRLHYELSGNTEDDIAMVAQLFTDELEKAIRKHPHLYFWVNKRWKTRPPEEKGINLYE